MVNLRRSVLSNPLKSRNLQSILEQLPVLHHSLNNQIFKITFYFVIINYMIIYLFLVLFLHFRRKTRLIKWASVCVSLCVCMCVCVQFWSPPLTISKPVIRLIRNIGYRNSPTPLIPFLNFENYAQEKFLKFIFSPFN